MLFLPLSPEFGAMVVIQSAQSDVSGSGADAGWPHWLGLGGAHPTFSAPVLLCSCTLRPTGLRCCCAKHRTASTPDRGFVDLSPTPDSAKYVSVVSCYLG